MTHKFKMGDTVIRTGYSDTIRAGVGVIKGEKYKVLAVIGKYGNIATCQTQIDEGHGWLTDGFELYVEPTIDFTKPLETLDGTPVTLITTSGRGEYPIIGYIGSDNTQPTTWTVNGYEYADGAYSGWNLRNIAEKPVTKVVWLNVYEGSAYAYYTYSGAIKAADESRIIARKRVEIVVVVVGEFDTEESL